MTTPENVELEQVPLKTDTDMGGEEAKTVEKKQRKWPFATKQKKTKTTEETITVTGAGGDACQGEKAIKCHKWWPEMSVGLNMLDRDEKGVASHVALSFEDVFAEPDQTQSWDCVWRLLHRIFSSTRLFIYRLLALIIVIPLALIFGVLFAIAAVLNNFIFVPCARLLVIPLTWLAKAWNFLMRSIFDPLFRSVSLLCSGISIRRYGLNSDPTADVI